LLDAISHVFQNPKVAAQDAGQPAPSTVSAASTHFLSKKVSDSLLTRIGRVPMMHPSKRHAKEAEEKVSSAETGDAS
jgi:hypothetical protein